MHKFLATACLLPLWASASLAQGAEYPKFDFSAGYALNFSDLKGNIQLGHETFNGFTLAAARNINKKFGIEGDLTYTTKRLDGEFGFTGPRVNLFSYMGPAINRPSGKQEASAIRTCAFWRSTCHGTDH